MRLLLNGKIGNPIVNCDVVEDVVAKKKLFNKLILSNNATLYQKIFATTLLHPPIACILCLYTKLLYDFYTHKNAC